MPFSVAEKESYNRSTLNVYDSKDYKGPRKTDV